jgi:hypothetical protein
VCCNEQLAASGSTALLAAAEAAEAESSRRRWPLRGWSDALAAVRGCSFQLEGTRLKPLFLSWKGNPVRNELNPLTNCTSVPCTIQYQYM